MAVSYKVDGVNISSIRDRAMFDTFANHQSYIVKDIGDELAVTYTVGSFIVTLGTGEAVICGGSMLSEGASNTLTLGANENGYIVIEIDLSQTGENVCQFAKVSNIVQANINDGTSTVYDLPLYEYSTSGSGISYLNDIRDIRSSSTNAMGKVNNPTNNDVLVTNAEGQAVDSGIPINELSKTNHVHGDISSAGTITGVTNKATDDSFVLVSASNNKVIKSNIKLGENTNAFLRNDGVWAIPGNLTVSNLWTNTEYTKDFAAQTISIASLNTYKLIIILFIASKNGLASTDMNCIVRAFTTTQFRVANGRSRKIKMSSTGITISNGIGAGGESTEYNGECIPYQILGVK